MKVSQAQLDVWKARAKLDRLLAGMTFAQRKKYFEGTIARVKAKTGIDLSHLPVMSAPVRRRRRKKECPV
jgi:hypothetical protein